MDVILPLNIKLMLEFLTLDIKNNGCMYLTTVPGLHILRKKQLVLFFLVEKLQSVQIE